MSGYGGISAFRCIYCGGYLCVCVPDEDDVEETEVEMTKDDWETLLGNNETSEAIVNMSALGNHSCKGRLRENVTETDDRQHRLSDQPI